MTNDTTTELPMDLEKLAASYVNEATPVGVGEADTDEAMRKAEVDLQITTTVYDAAMARANSKGQRLAAVARAVLFLAAAHATPDPAYRSEITRPPLREYTNPENRTRLRFRLPKVDYDSASRALRQSGTSVSQAVEDGLALYARTGQLN
jgi:hypothetical protein